MRHAKCVQNIETETRKATGYVEVLDIRTDSNVMVSSSYRYIAGMDLFG